jgi:hypothetical protein
MVACCLLLPWFAWDINVYYDYDVRCPSWFMFMVIGHNVRVSFSGGDLCVSLSRAVGNGEKKIWRYCGDQYCCEKWKMAGRRGPSVIRSPMQSPNLPEP